MMSKIQSGWEAFAAMCQPSTCLCVSLTGLLSLGLWSTYKLIHHVHSAQAVGLPFVVLPFSLLGAPWQVLQFAVVPFLKFLPERLTRNWLPLLLFNEYWHNGYEPFKKLGVDTFLAVSPGG